VSDATAPRDGYAEAYAEKLWEWLPAWQRDADAQADPPGVLRALIEVIASQAAVLRRSHDRLWEDQFAASAASWAVPYLGELVGTRPVAALSERGRRIDVAKTVYYRRRAGTLRVLEELIADVTGWEGTAVEMFRRLARSAHGLDGLPGRRGGPRSGTPPGGVADLRSTAAAARAGGAWDEYAHLPDLRRPRGRSGWHGLSRLVFFLHRVPARPLVGVMPAELVDGGGQTFFTFDPSGRGAPLFMPPARPERYDDWRAARPWELPGPMPCRLLGHAEFTITEAVVQALEATGLPPAPADELRLHAGLRFGSEARLLRRVGTFAGAAAILTPARTPVLLAEALCEDCGSHALLVRSPVAVSVREVAGAAFPPHRMVAGSLVDPARYAAVADKDVVVDAEGGRFVALPLGALAPDGYRASYYDGFPAPFGAGSYERRDVEDAQAGSVPAGGGALVPADLPVAGTCELQDNATYGPVADRAGLVDAVIQAANGTRPYLRLAADWVLTAAAAGDPELVLDGLWIGAPAPRVVRLAGDFQRVTLRRCTLDPGGLTARRVEQPLPAAAVIPPVRLEVTGMIEELVVDRCILGPVGLSGAGHVERCEVSDSILQEGLGAPALDLPSAEVHTARTTLVGALAAARLHAGETLVTGHAEVTDTQAGCFRFSAGRQGSRLPRAYESARFADPGAFLRTTVFSDLGYAELNARCPDSVRRGAENGSEIGAFSSLQNPIKEDGLRAKVEEFLPFGLLPVLFPVT